MDVLEEEEVAQQSAYAEAWRAAWEPADRRPIYEVLADELVLGNESPYPGPFDIANSGWIKEPMDAIAQDGVERVLVSGAAQLAKTLLGLIFLIYCIKRRPGLTTWNGQTDDAIKKVAEDKAWPLLRRCKSVMELMPGDHNKARIRSVVFPHMSLRFQSASENNAHGDTVKNQINDERHLWPAGMIKKFDSRVGSMPNRKQLDLSTGSVRLAVEKLADGTTREHGDDFFNDWQQGDRAIWSVECPECGRLQPLAWKHRVDGRDLLDTNQKPVFGIVWDEDEITRPGGRWNFGAVKKTARWRCRADELGIARRKIVRRGAARIVQDDRTPCRFELADSRDNIRRLNSLERGARYVVTHPLADPIRRSFRFPAMVSELVGWGTLVVEWLKAIEAAKAGDFSGLKTFIQNRLAEAWDESETVMEESNPTGDYELGDEWLDADGALKEVGRFLSADRQRGRGDEGEHYWVLCRQVAANGESRLVFFGKLTTEADVRAKQLELAVPDKCVLLDSGDNAKDCYDICAKYGWIALKGDKAESFAHPNPRNPRRPIRRLYSVRVNADPSVGRKRSRGTKAAKRMEKVKAVGLKRFARLHRWSNPGVKDILARLIAGASVYWGRPTNEPREYTDQLNSEVKRQIKDERGRLVWRWQQIRDDNHARDCEAQIVVAMLMSGLLQPVMDVEEEAPGEDGPDRPNGRDGGGTISPPLDVPSPVRKYRLKKRTDQ